MKVPAIVALHLSTTKMDRVAPNHLSIMPANLTCCATVRAVIVVGLLINPHIYSIGSREVSTAPSKVLTIRSTGVHKVAISHALLSIVLCIGSYGVVPSHGTNADSRSSCVVSVEVVLV
ncbi:hypothetical protein ES319_1Z206200v1 [Gossypium barbadense]|uniref:Uncharacterized protein n=1 Tax=Gossypium barbadense TaxID=3634 RepID=A0A5J5NAR8_GOSBA|nr:hypothetical protein ES319_1Z206200v1 [Gossypium barbadense]